MATLGALARDLRAQLGPADILDIALVAVLLYAAFVWFRDRASRALGVVLAILLGIFLLANWLELYLTALALHYGMIGILLGIVVVFQDDLRHGLERLASSRWFFRQGPRDPAQDTTVAILDAVDAMARDCVGALIVFPRRQPLGRHVRGGVDVDAKISTALLLNIFYPNSPGHDGAVVIDQDRVAKMAVHLPLTSQVAKLGSGGTRHAAALGLAERTDAMVVAVSEERGTISVADRDGIHVVGTTEFSQRLDDYYRGDGIDRSARQKTPLASITAPVAAVVAAFCLWLMLSVEADRIQRTFVVPVQYRNVPETVEIAEPVPRYVEVTLSGSEPAFALLDPTAVAVSVEVTPGGAPTVLRWRTETLLENIPGQFEIEQVVPEELVLRLNRK